MYTIENEEIMVSINKKGSELVKLFDKEKNRDYLWNAGEEWPKHAPVLFPTIGGFQNGKYLVNGKEYSMGAHGFARDYDFELEKQSQNEICMLFKSNDDTKKMYPFDFEFRVSHKISGRRLQITWNILNTSSEKMYFSIGGHPGFLLEEGSKISDYEIRLDKNYDLKTRRVIGRLVSDETYEVAKNTNSIPLTKELLLQDALILEEGIKSMALVNKFTDYCLKLNFDGFPVVAIWTRPDCLDNARYICIEPWIGLNDTKGQAVAELSEKRLIQALNTDDVWERSYFIEL